MTVTGTAAGLLLATLAFALAFMPPRARWRAVAVATAALLTTAVLAPAIPEHIALTGWGVALIAVAIAVYVPAIAARHPILPLLGALGSGGWSGALLAADEPGSAAAYALGFAGIAAAASLAVHLGWGLALRVATSWVVAVAILVGTMPYFVAHPGYVPDHRE